MRVFVNKTFLINLFAFSLLQFGVAQSSGDPISIGEYKTIHSEVLNEDRLISIRLPRGYGDSELSYPVVYHFYGDRIDQYFAEAVSAVSNLAGDGAIPEVILIGIDERQIRYRDLLPQSTDGTDTGIDKFSKYVSDELIPYVESNYRTKDFKIMVGPQVAANFALYTLFDDSALFDAHIITNPFRWRGGRDLLFDRLNAYLTDHQSLKNHLFITHNDDPNDALELEGNTYINRFKEIMNAANLDGFELKFDFIEGAMAGTSQTGLKKGLLSLFDGYIIPAQVKINTLKDFQEYYNRLAENIGFEIDIPERTMVMKGYELMDKGEMGAAEELLKYLESVYSGGFNAMWSLAQLYRMNGEKELALRYYKEVMLSYPFIKDRAQQYIDELSK